MSVRDRRWLYTSEPGEIGMQLHCILLCCDLTMLNPFQVRDVETATFAFASGGGFSNAFVRPQFQDAAVAGYLEQFAPPYGPDVFNRSGRAFPDVSASGYVTFAVNSCICRSSDSTEQVAYRNRSGRAVQHKWRDFCISSYICFPHHRR